MGLEIGALRNAMPVPNASKVLYSDILTPAQLDELYPGSRHPDVISDSEHFPTVAAESFDFVVANHVLEHVTDVLGALTEWHRILRRGGLLLLSVPDKRYTFDHRRSRTPLSHIISDHDSTLPPLERNEGHLFEWAEYVEGLTPGTAEFEAWTAEQKRRGYAVHNHVWVAQDVLRLVAHLSTRDGVHFDLVKWSNTSPFGNEFTLLLRKETRSTPAARRRLAIAVASAIVMHPCRCGAATLRRIVRGAARLFPPL